MQILRTSVCALSVRFTPLISGELHVEILMPYFVFAQGIKIDLD